MLPLLMPPSLVQQLLSLPPSLPHVLLLSLPLLILTPHYCRPSSPLAASTAIISITATVANADSANPSRCLRCAH